MTRIINRRSFLIAVLLMTGLNMAGCDSISSIKEYFQEPAQEENDVVSAPETNPAERDIPVAPQKAPSVAVMTADTLARVGSWSITKAEFEERLSALKEVVPDYDIRDPQARRLVLDELVNQQILIAGAEKSGLVNQKDIEAAVEEFRRTLIVREVARQLTEGIEVSESEARNFYNANAESWVGPGEWHVRELVVETQEEASRIRGELLAGSDFAEKARIYSIGKTAADGGDLGFIVQEPFEQMGMAILDTEVGGISDVFEGPEGFYIVKLEEKKEGAIIPFDDIKEEIIQSQTLLKQQQVILDHLDKLRAATPVEINEQLL